MTLLLVLAGIAAFVGVPALVDVVRRRDLRSMALRNIVRRPFETALIVIGSALGTAIIVAAFMVGDTFEASILDIVRRNLGEVDLVIEMEGADDTELLASLIRSAPPEGIDGILTFRGVGTAVAAGAQDDPIATSPDRPVEPLVGVNAIHFADLDDFGSDPAQWGLPGVADPGLDGVVINTELATDLDVATGDVITVFATGLELELEVRSIVDTVGLGGWSDMYVSTELFDELGVPDTLSFETVVLSLTGTLFDSTGPNVGETTEALIALVEASPDAERLLAASPAEGLLFDPIKERLIEDASEEDTELTTLFFVVGGFSVLAGILLLINLFVMLSEERKPNLGVLRAIGWNRSTLRRSFRTEGLVYAVPSSLIGSALGVGVGWVIIQLTRSIFANENPDGDFELITSINIESLLISGIVGFVISMLSVWFTSWRISQLNIVSAIRDLPAPQTTRSRTLRLVSGVGAIIIGAVALRSGLGSGNPYFTLVSVPLIVLGLALLLRTLVSPLLLSAFGGALVISWGLLIFEVLPDDGVVEIEFFLAYGIVLVAGGVALATVSGTVLQRFVARSSRVGVAARLAMAYPSARLFRTASSLAMYSLIIFSLAFMAVLASGIESQSDDIISDSAVGYDLLVQSLNANPLTEELLEELDSVEVASAVTRSFAEWSATFDPETASEPGGASLTAADPSFAQFSAPVLLERDARFDTDREAFEYVLANSNGVLVQNTLLGSGDAFAPSLGDTLVASETGLEFEILGIYGEDFTFPGIWINASALAQIDPEARARRIYVAVADDVDAEAVGDQIEATFIANGANAETFEARVNRILEANVAFFSLLRGYLLLGLLIGIGGLAVTLSRAVRERRRQIGMLRSMGLDSAGVGRWFLGEAAFISLMGIACGAALGVLSAYFVATRSTAIDGGQAPFSVPWFVLGLLVLIPLGASAVAALLPARKAARLRPSEALRLAD